MFSRLIARQLRIPTGILGALTGRTMNRVNADMNAVAVRRLEIGRSDSVLEIGFGGGGALALMAEVATAGLVAGVELSAAMLRRARRRFGPLIRRGRMEVQPGSAEEIPYPDGRFDRVVTVNTVYFWPDPEAGAREIRRVLKPGGRLALCFRPREVMESLEFTRHGFRLYTRDDVAALLEGASFSGLRWFEGEDAHLGYCCVVAEAPPAPS